MSKFLKFIVHFIIICTILCIVALSVPPLLGIKTTIIDGSYTDTNMLLGSVTYSIQTEPSDLKLGDSLVVENGTSVRRYTVMNVNLAGENCLVKDPIIMGDYTETISIKNGAFKTILAVEGIGYLMVATQSKEGMVILGIAVLVLIILYIIAELWKKNPSDKKKRKKDDDAQLKSAKELRREERERIAQQKMEEKLMRAEEKSLRRQEKKHKKGSKTVRTGGFIDEIDEDDDELEELFEEREERPATEVQAATTEAHEELKKEIAAATAEMPTEAQMTEAQSQKGMEAADQSLEEEPAEIKDVAIPLYTAEELARKVKESGDIPDVMREEISKVVLFDYSKIIGEDDSEDK
ncbi:MAG: hypothetical protein Q4E89_06255 [Eubacteriales bacterium]|nr:hypothetical protein [Eubacteriales bacterium]